MARFCDRTVFDRIPTVVRPLLQPALTPRILFFSHLTNLSLVMSGGDSITSPGAFFTDSSNSVTVSSEAVVPNFLSGAKATDTLLFHFLLYFMHASDYFHNPYHCDNLMPRSYRFRDWLATDSVFHPHDHTGWWNPSCISPLSSPKQCGRRSSG